MRASVFIATSLDGFIARKNGDLDWLGEPSGDGGEDYGYRSFIDSVDLLVMGRNTFELALSFDEWPYGSKPVVVLSGHSIIIPESIENSVEQMSCSPAELIERLSQRAVSHIYVDGGKTIQGFLNAGLIQRLIITRVPVLIGEGIALFGSVPGDIRLRHIGTRAFADGLVQSEYEVTA